MSRRDRLAWAGWALAVVAVPLAIDITAFRGGHESMSRLWARGILHPVAGPIVAGATLGLAWHLAQTVLDEAGFRRELANLTDRPS